MAKKNTILIFAFSAFFILAAFFPVANAAWKYNPYTNKLDYYESGTAGVGTVTSVGVSVPTGFTSAGGPITGAGTIAITQTAGYITPTTTRALNWDTAYGWGDWSGQGFQTQANVNAYIHASTTIPKTYTANTFTGLQTFGNSSTTLGTIASAWITKIPNLNTAGLIKTIGTDGTLGIDSSAYITASGVPGAETDSAHDTCAEIAGCVVGAITANQTITLTGAVTGSGATSIYTNVGTTSLDYYVNNTSGITAYYNSASDVIGGFSGCSGIQYLGADGGCHTDSEGSATFPFTPLASGNATGTVLHLQGGFSANGSSSASLLTVSSFMTTYGSTTYATSTALAITGLLNCVGSGQVLTTGADGHVYCVTDSTGSASPEFPSGATTSLIKLDGGFTSISASSTVQRFNFTDATGTKMVIIGSAPPPELYVATSTTVLPLLSVNATTTDRSNWTRASIGTNTPLTNDVLLVQGGINPAKPEIMRCYYHTGGLSADQTTAVTGCDWLITEDVQGITTTRLEPRGTTWAGMTTNILTAGASIPGNAAAGDGMGYNHLTAFITASSSPVFEALIAASSSSAQTASSAIFMMGFSDTQVGANANFAAEPNNGVYFVASSTANGTNGTGNWIAVIKNTSPAFNVQYDTGVASTTPGLVNVFQKMRIELSPRFATFLINDKIVATYNFPSGNDLGGWAYDAIVSVGAINASKAKNMNVAYLRLWMNTSLEQFNK